MPARSKTKTKPRTELMMEMLLTLMEEFAERGQTDEAGPHIHELMGITYRGAPLSPLRGPARQSASRRASAPSRP